MSKVYLVGDEKSPQSNQWLAMCASHEAAQEFAETLSGPVTQKEVEVKPRWTPKSKRA